MIDVTEFEYLDTEELHLVKDGANTFLPLLAKAASTVDSVLAEDAEKGSDSDDGVVKFVSAAARRKYAASGVAMPDGAFPIADEGHLRSAIGRLGNYKGDKAAAKRHIIKRAKALGLTHLLPEDWHVSKGAEAEKAMSDTQDGVQGREKGADVDDSLGQTRANGDDEVVHGDVQNDEGKPQMGKYSQPRPDEHTGYGDTAPDKSLPESEALSQTREEHAEKNSIGPNEASSEGTVAPNRKRDTARAERVGEDQTRQVHEGEGEAEPNAEQLRLQEAQSQKARKPKKHIAADNPDADVKGKADSDPGNPA